MADDQFPTKPIQAPRKKTLWRRYSTVQVPLLVRLIRILVILNTVFLVVEAISGFSHGHRFGIIQANANIAMAILLLVLHNYLILQPVGGTLAIALVSTLWLINAWLDASDWSYRWIVLVSSGFFWLGFLAAVRYRGMLDEMKQQSTERRRNQAVERAKES